MRDTASEMSFFRRRPVDFASQLTELLSAWDPKDAQKVVDVLRDASPSFKAVEDEDPEEFKLATRLSQVQLDATSAPPAWMVRRANGNTNLSLVQRVLFSIADFAVDSLPQVSAIVAADANSNTRTLLGATEHKMAQLIARGAEMAVKGGWKNVNTVRDLGKAWEDIKSQLDDLTDQDVRTQALFLYVLAESWLVPSARGLSTMSNYSGVDALRSWLLYKDNNEGKTTLLNQSETHGARGMDGYDVHPFLERLKEVANAGDPTAADAYKDIVDYMSMPANEFNERDRAFEDARGKVVLIARDVPSLREPLLEWVRSSAPSPLA
jgi:hypothetical protein